MKTIPVIKRILSKIKKDTTTNQSISNKFDISRATVSYIKSGKAWSHITGKRTLSTT